MTTRGSKIEDGGWPARSVLERGGPLPLLDCSTGSNNGGIRPNERWSPCESARGLAQSKTCRSLLASLVFLAARLTAHAQNYSIDWFTIDGGGGTSTGGVYSVSGTIGQVDAGGAMTNGQYSLTGGFWTLPTVVQEEGAPTLTIVPAAAGEATISWTPNSPGFALQEAWSLSPTNWVNSASGPTNPIVVPAMVPVKFYRLFKP